MTVKLFILVILLSLELSCVSHVEYMYDDVYPFLTNCLKKCVWLTLEI